ncbi:MAG: hypothetical protein M3R38_04790 [Actinomycetota bacterium]|nr:hypothetical protein [Actinomycetota bacterium]
MLEQQGGMLEAVRHAAGVLFDPGSVVELRAFRKKDDSKAAGYFDDFEVLAREAARLNGRSFAVYATLNPVKPELLARAENRIEHYPEATTADGDILSRRWLPLDFDPVRESGASSTNEEKASALARAHEVRDYLREQGWPEPILADSGNGAHLLYRVDLPNDQDSRRLVRGVLEALAFRFDDAEVKVDTGVYNAARIWRLYGTTNYKGDGAGERPHRLSKLIEVPEEAQA